MQCPQVLQHALETVSNMSPTGLQQFSNMSLECLHKCNVSKCRQHTLETFSNTSPSCPQHVSNESPTCLHLWRTWRIIWRIIMSPTCLCKTSPMSPTVLQHVSNCSPNRLWLSPFGDIGDTLETLWRIAYRHSVYECAITSFGLQREFANAWTFMINISSEISSGSHSFAMHIILSHA
jgi:hypothetical protein